VIIILAVFFWGSWTLLPTFLGDGRDAAIAAKISEGNQAVSGGGDALEAEVDLPWYAALMSEAEINLGLDLYGGIDMTLQVEVEEAVISAVQRDRKPIMDAAERDGLLFDQVTRKRGEATLQIRGGADVGVNDVRAFMEKWGTYEYVGTATDDKGDLHLFAITDIEADRIRKSAVEQALETLRSRIDETGTKEPSITQKGGNRINVQLPGETDIQKAVAAIGTTAVLEFMMVDEEVTRDAGTLERGLIDAEGAMDAADYAIDEVLSNWLVENGKIPVEDRLVWEYIDGEGGTKSRSVNYVVKDDVILTGDDINDAHVGWNQFNEPYVALEFKPRGSKVFCDVTTENVGRRFAIVLDRTARSAPVIRSAICGGRASIEMGVSDYNMAMQEAQVLSLVLRTGALPAPVSIGEVRQVGSSLGEDAIQAGKTATVVGFGLVLSFMLIYYKMAGVISVIALCFNVSLVMAMLAAAGATLTLPGIAGIALTVGMAVDANIIIYERIREELRLGKSSRAAADTGFEKAFWAVLDANITTFIAGVVLYTYGSGPIKGFAVTLMIGILTTLFTGIFLSRTLMDFITRKGASRLSI
jgi:preprotein translocase subunit SecD